LATDHTNFFWSTEFEAGRLDGVHQSAESASFWKKGKKSECSPVKDV
jgi:hypothetical protein